MSVALAGVSFEPGSSSSSAEEPLSPLGSLKLKVVDSECGQPVRRVTAQQ